MTLNETLGASAIRKMKWRLLPFLCLLYVINQIDRGNLAFAALTMNKELSISPALYGMLSSIFFIPYFLFEVPSNMAMHRFGARKWIARIMVTWGLITSLAMFTQNFTHIAIVRFILGAAEAGFFPGVVYFLTLWFPQKERTKVMAMFALAMPIAGIIGSPFAGWILDAVKWGGMAGWRWLFFFEGLPAIICGVICWFALPNNPKDAKFLSDEEKTWITGVLEQEDAAKTGAKHPKFKEMFMYPKTWRIGLIYFAQSMSASTIAAWTAIVIKDFSKVSNGNVGLLGMIPPIFGLIALPIAGWHSDKTGERKWHACLGLVLCLIGSLTVAFIPGAVLKMIGLVVLNIGLYTNFAPFWTIPTLLLTGAAAAIGAAVINSLNSLGGFLASFASGFINAQWGSNGVFAFVAVFYVAAIILLVTLKVPKTSAPILPDTQSK